MPDTTEISLSNGDTITLRTVGSLAEPRIRFWEAALTADGETYRGFAATPDEAVIDLYRTKQLDEFADDDGDEGDVFGWVDEASGRGQLS